MAVLRKSPFFDFLNRREDDFQSFLSRFVEDRDYIEWNGFLLPNDYGDAAVEYRAIREACAMFDVSPLRKYRITGPESGAFLDRLVTRPVSQAPGMRGIYVVFCNEDGSLKDDAILHKIGDEDYLLLPSDLDHSAYFAELQQRFSIHDLNIEDCTHSLTAFALQGPMSAAVMSHMGFAGIEHLAPFVIRDFSLDGCMVRVARMGFTADLGYECWLQPESKTVIEQRIRAARESLGIAIPGYGLTALDACRLEGGFIVAGWDCSTEADPQPGFERSPCELGLGWLVDLDAADFVGKDALVEQQQRGQRYSIASFMINDPRKPVDGAELYVEENGQNQRVGSINCSAWSETLGCMIGNASLESRFSNLDKAMALIDGGTVEVKLAKPPLLTLEHARQVPAGLEISSVSRV